MIHTREVMIRENRIIIALLSVLTVIAVGFVLYQIRSIILPFALAVFISYLINPVIEFFEKRHMPSVLAIILALIITFLVINVFGMLIYTSVRSFAAEFPKYSQRLNMLMFDVLDFLRIPRDALNGEGEFSGGFQLLTSIRELSLHRVILNTLGSLLNFMSNSILVLLFLLFIMIGRNQLARKVQVAFEAQMAMRIAGMLKNINKQIQRYLIAKSFTSLATGLLFYITLRLFDLEFAIIWGLLAFLLNFIPNIGSVIATILPLLIAFIQFDNIAIVFWMALILSSIQMVIGNFLDPRIVGRSLNLSPLVVLFSLMFWGWLWGVIGMFLAVPISVILKIILENVKSLRFMSVLMSHSS
ncbi:MAG: AI-2E family transporter [Calditrichaeota bacterium]|nr:MAG: AI-2E family transporter [Calditrichota bacterium]